MAPIDVGNESAANAVSLPCPRCRARIVTMLMLIVVATGVALANLSSESATIDFLKKTIWFGVRQRERPFGWPLVWYWRTEHNPAEAPQWPISRLSAPRLFANAAIWLVLLAATVAACRWLLSRHRPTFPSRPRISTLIVLIVVAVPMVLANLSRDRLQNSWAEFYGWPLLWYGHFRSLVSSAAWWEFSRLGLLGNLLAWSLILALTWVISQWLARRYRPRLRWNLKTLLAATALVAVACSWFAGARNRAKKQDALIEFLGGEDSFRNYQPEYYYVERWGPNWLDLVAADRFRRSIVGADVQIGGNDLDDLFKRLADLPDLRFLNLSSAFSKGSVVRFSRPMCAALRGMRHLRILNVECENTYGGISTGELRGCIAAIGKLVQLERLGIQLSEESIDDLAELDKLTNLKSLKLSIIPIADGEDSHSYGGADTSEEADERENDVEPRTLVRLPPLPRLEVLTLHEWELGDQHLGSLTGFPRLKSLDLSWTTITGAGLAKLAPLGSLTRIIHEVVAASRRRWLSDAEAAR